MTPILRWQYERLEDTLGLLEGHLTDPSCPCSSNGEACVRKHLKLAEAYAAETVGILARGSDISRDEVERLGQLADEAKQFRLVEERRLCGDDVGDEEPVDIGWAGNWRKYFETLLVGVCQLASVGDGPDIRPETDSIFLPWLAERITAALGEEDDDDEPRWCFGVRSVNDELSSLAKTLGLAKNKTLKVRRKLELPINICKGQAELFAPAVGVLDPYGSRCRDPETGLWSASEDCGFQPAGLHTEALGMDGLTRYEFDFRLVSLVDLVVSHDPFTFEPNPDYPQDLQPRLRERAATRIQVEKIAANLEPDALVTDFHTLDRGSPIIGADMVVEAGNGRVMALVRAAQDYPDKYALYLDRLRARARDFGLRPHDVDGVAWPVLVRLRLSDVDRVAFSQEANSAATLAPSAIENARTDADKITVSMLMELSVGETQSLEDALRSSRNKGFANRFLATLPENVQASLVDSKGFLNRDGVHRMAMAVFVSAFQGDTGLRLAEKAFESVDMDVRNSISAIARSLGPLAQAEALIRSGERQTDLSIGDDLAQAVTVYSAIKRTPELTVETYLAQGQMLERELTDFEERVLIVFDNYRRSPRKLGAVLGAYAGKVIDSPPPAQATMIPGASLSKEQMWEDAVRGAEAEITLFDAVANQVCELPSARYQYLATFFTESGTEDRLFATEATVERKIDTVLAQLEQGISEIHDSANFRDFIDAMARFHSYSLGNIVLIAAQMPGARRVAGYTTWRELGRQVKKGERGIMILAPCFPPKGKKEEEEDDEDEAPEPSPMYFKVVHVFDVSQTYGEELPQVDVPVISGDETRWLCETALLFIAKQGITVSSDPKLGDHPDAMGYWSPGQRLIWVRPDVAQDQRTKTLLHEIAHALAHIRGASDAEVMAESVAYVVASHFGFDTGARSFPYVAVWAKDVKVLKSNLETIRKVGKEMIDGIEHVAELSVDEDDEELAEVVRALEKVEIASE